MLILILGISLLIVLFPVALFVGYERGYEKRTKEADKTGFDRNFAIRQACSRLNDYDSSEGVVGAEKTIEDVSKILNEVKGIL